MLAIDLHDIQYRYSHHQNQAVLNIPTWKMERAETTFLHGPSGSGKSTLLNIISGVMPIEHGKITVLGERIDRLSSKQRDHFRANHIGYVFQQFNLIPYLDVIDNIRIATQFSQGNKTSQLTADIKTLLNQLNLPEQNWKKPARNLSVGQQQRVAIARALINKPQLLIADEPTSSLDHSNRARFMALLMPLVKEHDISLLFVSHDMALSHYFDQVEALSEINLLSGAV